ncbi:hypothetical protein ACHAWO_005656 [Cyclotella atomus]|uniref:Uncharacterized protein n=1 Tax=Cyclotella atomus TaxID=382360 RepID=A0ABD3P7V9_9STRA
MAKAVSTKTSAAKAKVTKEKSTAKKSAEKKTTTKSAASKSKTTTTAKKAPAKQHISIPKGWPVSSKPTQVAAKASDANGESQANHLAPGDLLKVNCNGSDVFLRKRATQPTSSLSLPTNSKTKGATRFLVVFPGRLSLKPPEKKTDSSKVASLEDEDKDDEEDVDGDVKEPAKKKSPFAPTNPPQLLGKLKEGPNNQMQLNIPFEGDDSKQLVFSGRAIPIDGKFLTLAFKRTGGKDSKKNGKVGTGSIICKDVFRSVIVLGGSKFEGGDSKPAAAADAKEEVSMKHYGGSDRTIDGGGQGGSTSRKSIGAKRDSLCSTKSSVTEKIIQSDSESNSESDAVDASDPDSDGEFVPTKKRRKSEEKTTVSEPKHTSRRSASKALNVSYADEESDVDMDKDDESELEGESKDDSSGESEDEFDELLDSIAKKPRAQTTKPKPKNGRESSASSASTKNSPYVEINSDEEDQDEDDSVVVIDSDASTDEKKIAAKSSKPSASAEKLKGATKQATKNGAATKTPKKVAAKTSSPLKSSVSPRKRKKTSPHKSPSTSKRDVWELSDDSFSFL